MTEYIQVFTTTGTGDDAQRIARLLVERHLAACVQIVGPITSVYRWEGKIERAEEWLCIAKSRLELFGELEQAIRQIHPYQVPEILAVPVSAGSSDYLAWVDSVVG